VKGKPYIEFLIEQFEVLGQIRARAMFGGYGLYCDEIFFALVANNEVFLKADGENRPDFEAHNLQAFRPFEGPEVMQYYQAPAEMFEDPEALKKWAGGAISAGLRAQNKKKPKKKRG
jgi:DNA transformation protein